MTSLIKRLESADGPNFALEEDIARTIGVWTGNAARVPNYTASIDAALTLVPDGFSVTIAFGDHIPGAHIWLCPSGGDSYGVSDPRSRDTYHNSIAIALCITALKARGIE